MRLTARLQKLERKTPAVLSRLVIFPGRSDQEADREAAAMMDRGEIGTNNMVFSSPNQPFGPPRIRELSCTLQELAWLDTRPEATGQQ